MDVTRAERLGFDPTIPSYARMFDYFMGGKDNFAADREAARHMLDIAPELPLMCREGRRHLARVVRHLTSVGVRQFLDLGCGLPTTGNVHEVAQAAAPGSRVVYVDNDPVVALHSEALLENTADTVVIEADLRDHEYILGHPRVKGLIDLARPVAVLLHFTLLMVTDDDEAAEAVAGYRDAVVPGSHIAVAHSVSDPKPEATAELAKIYKGSGAAEGVRRSQLRTKADVERFFDGLRLVEPGVVYIPHWRPEPGESLPAPETVWAVGGVGVVER
ncbi:SAM-dependent methyltransferase [Sphaerisporangium rubeum]|uniref:O-methyltransferase involved in polyketide biosynthesis n=1 Tax=Sphaerisporangium rubeum TaxID=321317 RepID=A0A7X0IDF7_9ACTN|nr:SAM-dependent methyltransferase [Sphaerisporangium rubeum]MBB6473116.1 O-methyltransferase involved in polyketide biosynthesis [Sphaerisporangium rubeum]